MQPGGSAASTAAWLGHIGSRVVFVGCVGEDPFGQTCVDALSGKGVEVRVTRSGSRATGTCLVIVDETRWADGDSPVDGAWARRPNGVGAFHATDAATLGMPNAP
jgi:sugar/nucleoside kinase (ribokinase family)